MNNRTYRNIKQELQPQQPRPQTQLYKASLTYPRTVPATRLLNDLYSLKSFKGCTSPTRIFPLRYGAVRSFLDAKMSKRFLPTASKTRIYQSLDFVTGIQGWRKNHLLTHHTCKRRSQLSACSGVLLALSNLGATRCSSTQSDPKARYNKIRRHRSCFEACET